MTKTVEIPHRPREIKVETKSRESSQSPPLVLKYLEALPAEKELTFLVEVVDKPSSPKGRPLFKVPKIIAENPGKNNIGLGFHISVPLIDLLNPIKHSTLGVFSISKLEYAGFLTLI